MLSIHSLAATVMLDFGRGKHRLERSKAKVLEGRLQENKDVGDFHNNSWQQLVA